jgi:hypothetical protein
MIDTEHCPNLTVLKEVFDGVKKLAGEVEDIEWS